MPRGFLEDLPVLSVSRALSQYVVSGFKDSVVAGAGYRVGGEGKERLPKFPCVSVACPTLEYSSEYFTFVLQVLEMFGGIQGGMKAVCDCKPANVVCFLPVLLP